jgi:hypothetical protein
VTPAFFDVDRSRQEGAGWGTISWVRGAGGDPPFEECDLIRLEAFLRRHVQVRQRVANGFQEEALFRFARDESGAGISSTFPAVAGVEPETAFLLCGAMTFDAAVLEQGTDVVLKKVVGLGVDEQESGEGEPSDF